MPVEGVLLEAKGKSSGSTNCGVCKQVSSYMCEHFSRQLIQRLNATAFSRKVGYSASIACAMYGIFDKPRSLSWTGCLHLLGTYTRVIVRGIPPGDASCNRIIRRFMNVYLDKRHGTSPSYDRVHCQETITF
jgi:hypothetical protein